MEQQTKRVHAKKFIKDLRAGKTREELMVTHELSPKSLDKTLRLLVEKQLIEPSEAHISENREFSRPADASPFPSPNEALSVEGSPEQIARKRSQAGFPLCPQCGAQVSSRALICPECGHVLPGEERWERVERKKTLLDRMSPKTLGILIALPIALIVVYVFKDIILPMTEATIDKRVNTLRQEMPVGKSPQQTTRDMVRSANTHTVALEVERLKTAGVLSESEPDYTAFVVGPFWEELPIEERVKVLEDLRAIMLQSSVHPSFRLLDVHRQTVATVTRRSVVIGSGEAAQTFDASETETEAPQAPQAPPPQVLRT